MNKRKDYTILDLTVDDIYKNNVLISSITRRDSFKQTKLYKEIYESTKFLNNSVIFAERFYCYINKITELQKCEVCGEILKYASDIKRYRNCSNHNCWDRSGFKSPRINLSKTFDNYKNNFLINYFNNNYEKLEIDVIKKFIDEQCHKNVFHNLTLLDKYKNEICNIIDLTKKLFKFTEYKDMKLPQRLWHIKNNNYEIQKCEICGKPTKFRKSKNIGYSKTCGNYKCSTSLIITKRHNLSLDKLKNIFLNNSEFELLTTDSEFKGLSCTTLRVKHKCGYEFDRQFSNGRHINKLYCPKCHLNHTSKTEYVIKDFLIKNGINISDIEINSRKIIYPKELDIFIPSKNIAIEFNGIYWHSEKYGKGGNYHLNKTKMCEKKEIKLIHIFENEWVNNSQICKNYLKRILGLNKYNIDSSKCEIKKINRGIKNKFLNKYHIKGQDKSSVNIGAFYKGRLVSVITFVKLRYEREFQYKLNRICSINNFKSIN